MSNNLVDLIIDQTKNKSSLKEISNLIFNYFSETSVNIILNNLETLIDFLNQYKKNLVISIIYNDELSNIIENIEEFYIYLKNIYTNQENNLKQTLFSNTQETEDFLNEQLIFYNFLFEKDGVEDDINENNDNEQFNISISPDDFPENLDNTESEKTKINGNNNQNSDIYYELTIVDLLKYNFNLQYIKQFLKDIIELIKIISSLEKQTVEELKF